MWSRKAQSTAMSQIFTVSGFCRTRQESSKMTKAALTWYHGPRMPKEGFILSCPHIANNNGKQSLIRLSSLILQHPLFHVIRYVVYVVSWHYRFLQIKYDLYFEAAPAECGEKLSIVGSQLLCVDLRSWERLSASSGRNIHGTTFLSREIYCSISSI